MYKNRCKETKKTVCKHDEGFGIAGIKIYKLNVTDKYYRLLEGELKTNNELFVLVYNMFLYKIFVVFLTEARRITLFEWLTL